MADHPYPVWVNGNVADQIPVTDRGLAYGDGLFETLRCKPRMVLPERHLERLSLGLERLGMSPDVAAIRDEIYRYEQDVSPGIIKLTVTRGSGGRGYLPPDNPAPTVIIQGFPLTDYPASWYSQGIHLHLCTTQVSTQPLLLGIKHLNRLDQVLARQEFSATDCQEGLMSDAAHGWIEGTMSNLFLIKDETLLSAPLAASAVRGTMQRFIVEACKELGSPVRELAQISTEQLESADRVFLCNSVFGLWPVRRIAGKDLTVRRSVLFEQIQQKVMSLIS